LVCLLINTLSNVAGDLVGASVMLAKNSPDRIDRRLIVGLCLAIGALLVMPWQTTVAHELEDLEDSIAEDTDLLEISATSIGQATLNESDSSGSYELDIIGSYRLLKREPGQVVGDGRLSLWVFTVGKLGNDAAAMAKDAGLPWITSDVSVDESSTHIGVLAWQQQFFREQLLLTAGKLFVGNFVLSSDYYAANTSGFMNRAISNDRAGRYFDILGLGAQARWQADNWYSSISFADADAEDEIDFDSLADGEFVWVGEFGIATGLGTGRSEVGFLLSSIDQTDTFEAEDSVGLAFQHEYAEDAEYAVFGRYTWRSGGKVRPGMNANNELPMEEGGFVGWRWNRAFGRANEHLAVAAFYGELTREKKRRGFDRDQYGLESYWRVQWADWAAFTFDVQLMKNLQDDWEVIPGVRLKLTGIF
jgi:hypothetical protein